MTNPDVVDIEVILKDWAWTAFLNSDNKDAKKFKYTDVRLEVNWNRVEFVSLVPEYVNKQRNPKNESQVLFNSTYENLTSVTQDNSFTTERTTTSTCTTWMEKGFTKGMHVELKLAAPSEIMEVSTGFGKELHLNKGTEETQERSLTWIANTSVKVREGHRVTVSLEVQEENFTADYNVRVRISGWAHVVLTNLKDNNSFLYSVEGDISQILFKKMGSKDIFALEGRHILWPVKGKCALCYGIKQHIRIEEKKIE